MFIWWGPELIQFYNDAYRQTMGPERHPSALGQRGRDCWAEIWPIIGPQIEQVMSGGGATWHENQLVPVTRYGKLEQVYWTYGYSPIDEDDGIGGVLVVCRDVTRDVVAAAALREREAELARVQQIGRIGGLEVDLRTGFRNRRSPEYLLIHGLPPDAANETHEEWVQRIHPEDREATEKKFRDAVASEVREYSVQYRIIRPSDGEIRWISVKSTIERDENGKAIRLVGAHSDVTEQVVAEQALRQSEAEFRTLAEALPHHVWTATPDGSLNWFNPRVYEYAGSGPGELDGDKWGKIVHPDDAPGALAAWTRAIASGKPYEIEFRLRRADGAFRWFLARAVPARDEQGQIIRWIGTNTDVHDQNLIAGELAELNATLAQRVEEKTRERDRIWNVSQDLLLVADRDGVWRTVNPAWTRTLGWSEAELLNRTSEWLEHPDDGGTTRKQFKKLSERETTVRFESRFRHKDGSYRWLSWTGVSDKDHIYAVARDVTADKAAAERLKATEEALLQSQKMEAVGQLTGGIAHDFNNLLDRHRRIAGPAADPPQPGADRQCRALHQRGDDVGEPRRGAHPSPAGVCAAAAADSEKRRCQSAGGVAGGSAAPDHRRDHRSRDISVGRSVGHAVRPQPAGKRAAQSRHQRARRHAGWRQAHHRDVKCAARQRRRRIPRRCRPAIISASIVTDTGVGMSAEVAARAFDPFFTTKPIGQGTGLGLSMIYGFARQSNGHVTIDSKIGQGTSVKLYLPRHHGDIATEQASAVKAAEHAATGETVLVVEDEPVVRGVILEMLGEQGYRTLQAVDGPSGLQILRSDARIDLLVTDVGLPGMNGRQLADQARETRPDLKILFITGYAESVAIADGFLQPGMEMITKPFDLDNLSRRIRGMVSG